MCVTLNQVSYTGIEDTPDEQDPTCRRVVDHEYEVAIYGDFHPFAGVAPVAMATALAAAMSVRRTP